MDDNDHNKEVEVTDDSFFETTEQIQAVLGGDGFGTLPAIGQSKRKALSDTELNELARILCYFQPKFPPKC